MSTNLSTVCAALKEKRSFQAKGFLVGEHCDFSSLGVVERGNPAIKMSVGDYGALIGFRFGVIVFFDVPEQQCQSIISALRSSAKKVYEKVIFEACDIVVSDPHSQDAVKKDILHLHDVSVTRLEVIADVLAKSLIIEKHEELISERFASVQPIAEYVRTGKIRGRDKEILKYIGLNLFAEYELAGLAEVTDKPALLWEHPHLEVLYNLLLEDFDINDRQSIVDKKLEVITRTAQTYLDVSMHHHSSRLEWYIIVLIGVEIFLQLHAMFYGGVPH